MCFYMLMTGSTYIGNGNFGILVAVTGIVITASRIFDGITISLARLGIWVLSQNQAEILGSKCVQVKAWVA